MKKEVARKRGKIDFPRAVLLMMPLFFICMISGIIVTMSYTLDTAEAEFKRITNETPSALEYYAKERDGSLVYNQETKEGNTYRMTLKRWYPFRKKPETVLLLLEKKTKDGYAISYQKK